MSTTIIKVETIIKSGLVMYQVTVNDTVMHTSWSEERAMNRAVAYKQELRRVEAERHINWLNNQRAICNRKKTA